MELQQALKIENDLREHIAQMGNTPSFGDRLNIRLRGYCAESDEFVILMRPEGWMCNPAGAIHGGICATMSDQAMGMVAYTAQGGGPLTPTIDLNISFQRRVMPECDVILRVKIIAMTKRLVHMSVQGFCADSADKVCFTAGGTFFRP